MGLISDGDRYAVLSDILGDEDHLGDMDFKVTGTVDGITACQMDIKIKGLSYEILVKALKQAREGRLHILEKISETIEKPNDNVKAHAPKMVSLTIPNEFIGAVIGPGGKVIQEMQKETDTTIVIEEDGEFGVIEILGVNQEKIDAAIEKINNITFKPEVGKIYNVNVIKILDFGAVVEFVPGNEILLHISEVSWDRIDKVTDEINLGDTFDVKYFGIDPKTRKPRISRKALLPRPERSDRNDQKNRLERRDRSDKKE
jgi:polyribonucleotide nucleotidyltransferase